ncbi:ATP-binding cassette domain-containing protein [Janibacter hoylei]|uniref:ATP-binding cassette domain-containing protein n=1 Tax=Janibacter hoylei TaxID=364298 RepID=UPI00389A3730
MGPAGPHGPRFAQPGRGGAPGEPALRHDDPRQHRDGRSRGGGRGHRGAGRRRRSCRRCPRLHHCPATGLRHGRLRAGSTLSGGQRQRIAIARAVVRDAPVVILDEATVGLDGETEVEVTAALDRLTAGRTTIVITHDLDAARSADRIVWVDAGRVTDVGRPDEVLARHAGELDDALRPRHEGGVASAVGS